MPRRITNFETGHWVIGVGALTQFRLNSGF